MGILALFVCAAIVAAIWTYSGSNDPRVIGQWLRLTRTRPERRTPGQRGVADDDGSGPGDGRD